MKKSFLILAAMAGALFTACENGDMEFPDYKYSAVYFAYQSPIRTITIGEDESVDNSLDNEHKCQIMATVSGVYENKKIPCVTVSCMKVPKATFYRCRFLTIH